MLIWKRLGILGLIIPCVVIGPAEGLMPPADRDDPKAVTRAKNAGYALGSLVSALILWPLGRHLNRVPVDTPYDPQSGQPIEGVPGGTHTMFYMPLEYWAFIWMAFGLFRFFFRS